MRETPAAHSISAVHSVSVVQAPATTDPTSRKARLRVIAERSDPALDALQQQTFAFFWDLANPKNGLVPDRWPRPSFASIAAVGFGLTAYPIGVQRGFITRADARQRVLTTLRFFAEAPQGAGARGFTGYQGFFYHFLDLTTGARLGTDVELSTVDTALLVAGMLACQSYFDGSDGDEIAIRALVDQIYRRVDWTWAQVRAPAITMGWTPETGFHNLDWHGYDEAMIVYILALGSPTHPVASSAWQAFTSTYKWDTFYGYDYLQFGPLFGYEFSHVWIDFRGIQDDYMRAKGIDYFENSRRAAYGSQGYAIANPGGFRGYGGNIWGVTACDGPADVTMLVNGRQVVFHSYAGRGASTQWVLDDGTIAPTGAVSSVPFAPEIAIPAAKAMIQRYGANLVGTYGFLDSFNPTFTFTDVPLVLGKVVPGVGWFDTDYLGLDQGPIVAMIENYRNGFVWGLMRKHPAIVTGLQRAGFSGGWLDKLS